MRRSLNTPCPCGSKKKYKNCCYLYHKGKLPATPLALMKSRYSAYAYAKVAYIIKTTHPNYYPNDTEAWKEEIRAFCQSAFKSLHIIASKWDEKEGFVEFEAKIENYTLHEKSRFIKEEGRWYYCEGEVHVYQ